LVLGHQNCGAIEASLDGNIANIPSISKLIAPAIKRAKKAGVLKLEFVVKENVKSGVEFLKKDKDLHLLISQKKLKVVGGYYSLENGTVTFLDGEGKS
jgi:carbonic anhydrase